MRIGDGLDLGEFARRRERVLERLRGAVGLVLAGEGAPPLKGPWEPDWSFYYLTGIRDEPGAAVLLDPASDDPKRRCILFLKPLNPELEDWDGRRERLGEALRARTGFATALRTTMLARTLSAVARRRKRLACLHPFAVYDGPVSPDLALFRKVAERTIGVVIEDRTDLLPAQRAVKSRSELAMLERAVDATAEGFTAALRALRPGMPERELQRVLEAGFASGGAADTGYNSIVGAGANGTVLHYMASTGTIRDGDLVVIDAAARVGAYTADVTRTFPASGRFGREQREVYDIVLRALDAGIRAVRPGAFMWQVDAAARAVIDKAGYGDHFIHGIGHPIGLEVHDVVPDGPLRSGMVVTVEPGIYLPTRSLGIRIEDDILVTPGGRRNLTGSIPRTAEAIERAMAGGRRRRGRTR